MNNDPFAQFRISERTQSPVREEMETQEPLTDDPFSKFRLDQQEDQETWFNYLTRQAARTGSRVLETIGGLPGEARQFLNSIVNPIIDPIAESIFGKEAVEKATDIQEKGRILPTSKELKEKSEKLTQGYTKARSTSEELGDEFTETVTSLIGPAKFRKALALGVLGTGTRKGVELLGFEPSTQQYAKLGSLIIGSFFNPNGVKEIWKNNYNEALKKIPEGTQVSAGPLTKKLNTIKKDLLKGVGESTEKEVLRVVDEVLDKVKNNKIGVDELVASKRSINGIMEDPEFFRRAQHLFPKVNKAVDDAIKLYHNPEFVKPYRTANDAFVGFHQSQKLSRFLNKILGGKPALKVLGTAAGQALIGHPELIPGTLAGAGTGALAVKSYELMNRIMKSPTLRKYYLDMLTSAAKENTRTTIKAAEKLDAELVK